MNIEAPRFPELNDRVEEFHQRGNLPCRITSIEVERGGEVLICATRENGTGAFLHALSSYGSSWSYIE